MINRITDNTQLYSRGAVWTPPLVAVPPDSVARTLDAVFRQRAFARSVSRTLLNDIITWLMRQLDRLLASAASTPGAGTVIKWTAYLLAAFVIARLVYAGVRYYLDTRGGSRIAFGNETVDNLWQVAQAYAARGEYTAAAHTLYAALVRTLVLRGMLRFHPSKTTGDYVRELRRTQTGAILTAFVEFVRAYEVVVYRDGTCDAERYTRLRAMAEPVVRPIRAAAAA